MNVDPGPQTSFQGPQKRLKERRRTMVQWRKDDILRPLSVTILFLTSSPTPSSSSSLYWLYSPKRAGLSEPGFLGGAGAVFLSGSYSFFTVKYVIFTETSGNLNFDCILIF